MNRENTSVQNSHIKKTKVSNVYAQMEFERNEQAYQTFKRKPYQNPKQIKP